MSKQEIWELEEAICKAMADNARYRAKLGEQALKLAELRKEHATALELIEVLESRVEGLEAEQERLREDEARLDWLERGNTAGWTRSHIDLGRKVRP